VLLLSTSSLQWYGLHRIFQFAKESGYLGIDLALTTLNYDLWDEEYVNKLSNEFNIPVLSITSPLKWMSEEKVDKIIKIAQFLWSQLVTFTPPHYSDKNTSRFTSYIKKVKRNTTLTISIRNVESKFIFFVFPEYKNSTLFEIKRVTWNTTLDLSNIDISSWMDIMKAQKLLWWTIKNILLSDKRGTKKMLLPWQAGWFSSFLPLESFLMKLKTISYTWFITLKVRPSELWVWNKQKVLQNLEFIKDYYNKHFFDYK